MTTSDRAAAGAALDATGAPQAWNMRLVGHCPMDGRGDGMHINLKDGYAFFAHMGDIGIGTSIVDVRDPTRAAPGQPDPGPERHALAQGPDRRRHPAGQLRAVQEHHQHQGGLKVFDVSRPTEPREIGFLPMTGKGVHRMTYWEEPYAVRDRQRGRLDRPVPDHRRPVRPVEPARGRPLVDTGHARGRRRAAEPAARSILQAPSCPGARRSGVLRLVGPGPRHPRHRGQGPARR